MYILSFFLSPSTYSAKSNKPPTAGFPPPDIPVNCFLQPRLLCGCTKDSADTQARCNYWNINLSPQNPTVLWMCMKISLDANQSITLGSEGEKKHNQPPVLIQILPFCAALSGWRSTPNTPFLNPSLPQVLFLLENTVHTMEGFCFTFNVWPCKRHRKAEKAQDQKNQMWCIQSHLR